MIVIPEDLKIENYTRRQFQVSGQRKFIIPNEYLAEIIIVRYTPELGDLETSGYVTSVNSVPGFGISDEQSYLVPPGFPNDRRFIKINLDLDLPIELSFFSPPNLKKGYIEVFAFNPPENYQEFSEMSSFNNPGNVDFSPLIQAMQANSDAQVAATNAASAAENPTVAAQGEGNYTAIPWSNVPANHIAVQPDPKNIGGKIYNNGNKKVAVDRFVKIADKTAAPQHDGFIDPGGVYDLDGKDCTLGVLLYTLNGNGNQVCFINVDKKA